MTKPSNKIINTLRSKNVVVLRATIEAKSGGSGTDEYGNQYWSFTKLADGIARYETIDPSMAQYMRDAAAATAQHACCTVEEVLAEPYALAYNAKHDFMTDLTLRSLQYMDKHGMVAICQ